MPKVGRTKVAAKSTKLIHPQSRKANKLTAKELRKGRVQRVHQETSHKNSLLFDKLTWFKDALDPDKVSYSKADAEELIERYLLRFQDELEQIAIVNSMKSRTGRQHATREDNINSTKQREAELFSTCGIEIPDIIDGRNLKCFKAWDGNRRYIGAIKMRKVCRTSGRKTDVTQEGNLDEDLVDDNKSEDDNVNQNNGDGGDNDDDEGLEEDDLESYEDDDDDEHRESLEDEGVDNL